MITKVFIETISFIAQLYFKRDVMIALVKRDLKAMHAGSYLGMMWIYLQPIMYLMILYFVFTIGLRAGYVKGNIPFIVYLASGIIAWFYFADCLGGSTVVILKHSYLLKKIDFRLSILPGVNLIVNAVPHIVLTLVVIIICWVNGYRPTWYLLQLVYYYFAMLIMLLGISWVTSATNIFVPDVGNIVGLILQFGFWLTPIVWDIGLVPAKYLWVLKINPVFYIVEGYRNSLIYHIPFWLHWKQTILFWVITLLFCLIGAYTFRKLRPHFAEVV